MELIRDGNYLKFIPTERMTRTEQLNSVTRLLLYFLILLLLFYREETLLLIPVIGLIIVIFLYKLHKMDKKGKKKEFDRLIKQRIDKINNDNLEMEEEYSRDDKRGGLLNIQKEDYMNTRINIDKENEALFPSDGKYKIETGVFDLEGKLMVGPKELPPNYTKDEYTPLFNIDEANEYNDAVCRKPTKNNPLMNPDITDYGSGDVPVASNSNDEDIKDQINVNFNHELFRDIDEIWERENSQRQFYTIPNTAVPNNQTEVAKWLYRIPETCKEDTVNCDRWQDLTVARNNYNR